MGDAADQLEEHEWFQEMLHSDTPIGHFLRGEDTMDKLDSGNSHVPGKSEGAKVKCLTCGAVIQSMFRHDFKWCNCPAGSATRIFIDGGSDYQRMGFGKEARWGYVDQSS